MAFSTFSPTPDNNNNHHHHHHPHSRTPSRTTPKRNTSTTTSSKKKPQPPAKNPSSWNQIKSLITCKTVENSKVHDPSSSKNNNIHGGYSKLSSSCSSICNFRDVVHGNTRVVHRADNSPENSSVGQETGLLSRKSVHNIGSSSNRSTTSSVRSSIHTNTGTTPLHGSYTNSTTTSSSRGMQLRKLSGCYECHMIVDPSRRPITPRTTICVCKECGEIFPKIESLEHHQAIKHAVSELGPEDSGRNIVEIIFKSSWLKKDSPICKIERILKVHNTQRTIQRFEDCRDSVKIRATSNSTTRKNARCAADGNELLRFHCTSLTCGLGARGSTSLCGSVPGCGVCTIIRHGFPGKAHDHTKGVCTTATSGRSHDSFGGGALESLGGGNRRAMLVCRVIAGRVKRTADDDAAAQEEDNNTNIMAGTYDSVAGYAGIYANLEELIVFNPKAILPCFVVIYTSQ